MGCREIVMLVVIGLACAGKHDKYAGYTVHDVEIRDISDADTLAALESSMNLDILHDGSPGILDATVMVSPEQLQEFLDTLDGYDIKHTLKNANLQSLLEEEDSKLASWRSSRSAREALPYNDYPRYAEVDAYIERIAAQYPDLVTLVNVGNSYEGRPIKYLKISTTNFQDNTKPIYFMDSAIHAREWVTVPVTLYTIHRLLENRRPEDQDLLDGTDWVILPMVNPDGYEFTHTDDRMWRRTRSVHPSGEDECRGADANRNFDVSWNTVGVNPDPCTQTFPGVGAFSEPETQYVRDMLHEFLDRTQVYMNIHSYGNWVLYGFGNTTLPDNAAQLHHLGAIMGSHIDALKLPQASFYRVGNSALLLYPTSGSAQDYAQHIGVPFSYTLELPGYSYLFSVPPEYIGQINEETWAGIAAQARVAKLYYNARINNN